MPPIDIRDLKPQTSTHEDSNSDNESKVCNPPLTRIPQGRPKKKKMDKATYRVLGGRLVVSGVIYWSWCVEGSVVECIVYIGC